MTFAEILPFLQDGELVAREAWNKHYTDKNFITLQVEATVPPEVVPKMTSLSAFTKGALKTVGGGIHYHHQVLTVKLGANGANTEATYYFPTWEDIFAEDWYTIGDK